MSGEYSREDLNYFRICHVTTNILPRALRIVFKKEWDSRYKASHGQWLDTAKNAADFYNGESTANQKRLNKEPLITIRNGNSHEWDCTCLFFALLNSTNIGTTISYAVETSVKDLRDFRNKCFAHASKGSVLDRDFQTSIQVVIDAFKVLGVSTSGIEAIKIEKTFATQDLSALREQFKKENKAKQQLEEQLKKGIQEKRLLEEQNKALEEEMNAKPASFCSLPPKPSHETWPRTDDVLTMLREAKKLKRESAEIDEILVIYLSGNPGCGKSQVARQVGEMFYTNNQRQDAVFVMTLDAKNLDTVLESYTKFAKLVGCTEYSISKSTSKDLSKEEMLVFLKSSVMSKVRCFSKWLIIVDNVTDIKSVSQYWPQPGTKEWGSGLLVVTTQDSHSVLLADSQSHHISLSHGVKLNEAAALLLKISNVQSDNSSKVEEVAAKLDCQPLALACAAVYVRYTGVSWEQYLAKLEQGKREETEEVYESMDLTYRRTMTTAVSLAVQREVKNHEVLMHAFQYLSLLAPEKIPLEYVARYVLIRLPKADADVVKSKILSSSLVLILNTKLNEIKVHQVVHNILKLKVLPLASDYSTGITDSVLSFGPLVGCDVKAVNVLAAAQTLMVHFRYLVHTVNRICRSRGLLGEDYNMKFSDLGDCISVIGTLCRTHGEFELARDFHQQELAIRQHMYGNDHPHVADALNNLGIVYRDLGEYSQAVYFFQRALMIYLAVYGNDHPHVATSLHYQGIVCNDVGQHQQAKDLYQQALVIRQAVYGSNHPDVAMSLINQGIVCRNLKQHQQAKDFYQRALVIYQTVYGDHHPDVAASLNNLGELFRDLDQHQQAKDFFQRALVIYQTVYGEEHPDVATSLNNLGVVCCQLGQRQQAKDFYQRALLIYQAVYGNDHPHVATSLHNQGIVCSALGQHQEAKDFLQRALVIRQAVYGDDHQDVAMCLNNLGTVCRDLGEHQQAKDFYQQALVIRRAVHSNDHPDVATTLKSLGLLCHELGQYYQAKTFYQQALVIRRALHGNDHPEVAHCLNNLELVCRHLDRHQEARLQQSSSRHSRRSPRRRCFMCLLF